MIEILYIALGVVTYCGIGLIISIGAEEGGSYRGVIPLPIVFHVLIMLFWPVLVGAALIFWVSAQAWNRRAP